MTCNLGECGFRRRRRRGSAMAAFDGLPAPLRRWLSEAALPWSPASARSIWVKRRAKGHSPCEVLDVLSEIEARMLRRDDHAKL